MRTWGRINQVNGLGGTWVEVTTDAQGFNDQIFLTTLIQTLKLNLGEDPFYGQLGIPAVPSVLSQVQPVYYVNRIQQYFSPFFAALLVSKVAQSPNDPNPTYAVNITGQSGSVIVGPVAT